MRGSEASWKRRAMSVRKNDKGSKGFCDRVTLPLPIKGEGENKQLPLSLRERVGWGVAARNRKLLYVLRDALMNELCLSEQSTK
jgi:hypothetical protein